MNSHKEGNNESEVQITTKLNKVNEANELLITCGMAVNRN